MNENNINEIDRGARNRLIEVINSFLSGEITNVEFEIKLDEFYQTKDSVIHYALRMLWYFYDDCDKHYICVNKQGWDLMQRLLLMLAADNTYIEESVYRHWSLKQLIAGFSLILFGVVAYQIGLGNQLLIISVPCGLISILLFWSFRPKYVWHDIYQPHIFPFATISDLERAYLDADFKKVQYPPELKDQRIRSELMEQFIELGMYVMWLVFGPVVLLFQTLPNVERDVRIKATAP